MASPKKDKSSAKPKPQRRTRRTSTAARGPKASRRELNEDLHRYDVTLAPSMTRGLDLGAEDQERGPQPKLTRYQKRSIKKRRIIHLIQFLVLFGLLVSLLAWLVYASTLYL